MKTQYVRGTGRLMANDNVWPTTSGERSLLFSYPIALSGGRPFSIPLLIVHDVVRIVVRCRWLHKRRANVAGERIRRVERIVTVGLRRTVAYHGGLIVLLHVQVIFRRRLLVSVPVIADSVPGRLFLEGNCRVYFSRNKYLYF